MKTIILDPLIEAQYCISKVIQDLRPEKELETIEQLKKIKEAIHSVLLHYVNEE